MAIKFNQFTSDSFFLSFRLFLKFGYVVNLGYKMETVEIRSAKKVIFYILAVICIINIQKSLDDIGTIEIKEYVHWLLC